MSRTRQGVSSDSDENRQGSDGGSSGDVPVHNHNRPTRQEPVKTKTSSGSEDGDLPVPPLSKKQAGPA